MATYNDELALIVRYDGTKTSFENEKGDYKGKVVFIYGSSEVVSTDADKASLVQAIWVGDESGGRYLDFMNLDKIQSQLTHISGITIDGKTYYPSSGGGAIQLSGSNGISVSVNTSTGVVTFSGETLKSDLIGNTNNNSTVTSHPNTITGAKAYADTLASDLKGTKANNDTTAETIAGAKTYADNAVAKAKGDLIGGDADTTTAKTIAGAKLYGANKASDALKDAKQYTDEIKLEILGNKDTDNSIYGIREDLTALETSAKVTVESSNGNYVIKQGTETLGTISFADKVVTKGEVVTNPTGQAAGTYIKFTIANADPIYVNVADLIENYTAAANATEVQVAVNNRVISATIKAVDGSKITAGTITGSKLANGTVTKTQLDSGVQASLGKADKSYEKPVGGIPHSDLDSETQTLLGKANSAIQSVEGDSTYIDVEMSDNSTKAIVTAKTSSINTMTATTNGLATVSDVRNFLKAYLSVRVVKK